VTLQKQVSSHGLSFGVPIGTLGYMSPEQLEAKPLTGASDVFSLGIVLYELLTGHHPFATDSMFEMAHRIEAEKPELASTLAPGVPKPLDELILSMLAKDPGTRPSAEEVARKLAAMRSLPPATPTARPRGSGGRRLSRRLLRQLASGGLCSEMLGVRRI
jgi:eukaryotic-like serine/threonine-protein kinase